ncbi:hypothetical protein HYALB_00000907 [Hymenoscyphus albidus]|uniref:Uncharacterized protein n=1 Tax=Hymenoscyphus albidus TaxID=595503 RepID=A0A9N9LE21_9HELO|nr:hypothetical protein HYALB_00000907 [Hymenoscyphus albidus]
MGESEDGHRDREGKEHRRREKKHRDRKEKDRSSKRSSKSTASASASSSRTSLPEDHSPYMDPTSKSDKFTPEKSLSKDKDAKPKAQSSWWSSKKTDNTIKNPFKSDETESSWWSSKKTDDLTENPSNIANSKTERPSAVWSKSSFSSTGSSKPHSRKRGKHDKTQGPLTTTHVAIVGLGAGVIYGIHWFIFKKRPQYGRKLYQFMNPIWALVSRPFRPRISNVPGDRRYSVFSF